MPIYAEPNPITISIVNFLHTIGLAANYGHITEQSFVPGVLIYHGGILIDTQQLSYPSDILHEAGHLAVKPPSLRQKTHITAGKRAAEEMAAIGWSYAAAVYLGIDLSVLFHSEYKGGGQSLIDNFSRGTYIGVPILQWLGLTFDNIQAKTNGLTPYPSMQKWLVESEPNMTESLSVL
ncbi:hypothetical protein [Methylomonas sp. AM2-LC]|uniref:hypothetical protein n=1 Tax=Methylomonas sp. AM2-LC TaxID=3153301 RepID=UPI003266FA03